MFIYYCFFFFGIKRIYRTHVLGWNPRASRRQEGVKLVQQQAARPKPDFWWRQIPPPLPFAHHTPGIKTEYRSHTQR